MVFGLHPSMRSDSSSILVRDVMASRLHDRAHAQPCLQHMQASTETVGNQACNAGRALSMMTAAMRQAGQLGRQLPGWALTFQFHTSVVVP